MKVYINERCSDIQKAKEHLLKEHFCDGRKYEIQYLASGQPILICDKEQAGYISISHTDDTLAIAFASKPVGIDIERKDRKVSANICDSIEEWTKREAYGKMLGIGINKEILSAKLPDDIMTFICGEYAVSVCGNERVDGIITLIDNRLCE